MRIYYGTTIRDKSDQSKYTTIVHSAEVVTVQIKADPLVPPEEQPEVGLWVAHVPYALGMGVGFWTTPACLTKEEASAMAFDRAIDDGWTTFQGLAVAHAEKEKRAREAGLLRYTGQHRTDLYGKTEREYIDGLDI